MALIETFEGIANAIIEVVWLIFDAFANVYDALNEFYNMLKDFNDMIITMTKNPSSSTGLPVVEAIGVFRYLVGHLTFYVIYMAVLFGCLFTIYKLVCLLLEAFHALKEQTTAGSYSSNALIEMLTKFFK